MFAASTTRKLKLIFVGVFCFLLSFQVSFARDSFTSFRKGSFKKNPKIKQFFSFGGGYESDYNSREYKILSSYKHQSKKFIGELYFLHEATETSTTKKPIRKTEELYDFEASSRIRIKDSSYYYNIYNRIVYDEFSKFYYDVSVANGIGYLFLNGKIEPSINFGYNDVKNFQSGMVIIGFLRAKFNLTENLKFSIRGLVEKTKEGYAEEIKNLFSYRIRKNLFLELIHKYQKKRYIGSSKKRGHYRISRAKRNSYIRFKYNF